MRFSIPLFCRFLVLLVVVMFFSAYGVISARGAEMTPTDVFNKVAEVRANLEIIRASLGMSKNLQPEIPVKNVTPREVFYQAMTMQEKIYQLAHEKGAGNENERKIFFSKGVIKPKDVFALVSDAEKRLKNVINKLNLSKTPKGQGIQKKPTDVFKSIIQVNRQLNLMLKTPVLPSDVYQRVQSSINLVQVLREQFVSAPIPLKVVFEAGKKPVDVYQRLLKCFKLQREVLLLSKIKVMDIAADAALAKKTTPGDVYDMASLVFSEVRVAYLSLKDRRLTEGVFYPGPKKPAHVYQLVGVLEESLVDLLNEVKNRPDWLK